MSKAKNVHEVVERENVSKGVIFLLGAVAFISLYLLSFWSFNLVYTTLSPLPLAIPTITATLVAMFVNRVSKVYPGSAKIFAYASNSLFLVTLGIITLLVASNGLSVAEISIATAIISLVYPLVAISYVRSVEVFISTLGFGVNDDGFLEHIDTSYLKSISGNDSNLTEKIIEAVSSDDSGISLVGEPEEDKHVEFITSEAFRVVKKNRDGSSIIAVDLEVLAAERERGDNSGSKIEVTERDAPALIVDEPKAEPVAEEDVVIPEEVIVVKPTPKPRARKSTTVSPSSTATKGAATTKKAPVAKKPTATKPKQTPKPKAAKVVAEPSEETKE